MYDRHPSPSHEEASPGRRIDAKVKWFNATKDEIKDVQNLSMWLDVNGQRRQTGSTQTMIFSMAKCISYVSQFMTLLPGDIITTGTPPGVGLGMKPPTFLKAGDEMHLGIAGLGEQRQKVIAFA